jgi:hypothetical protein
MEGLMRMNLSAAGGQVDKAALEKSIESMKAAGRQETIAAFSLAKPVSVISLTTSEHPDKTADSTRESIQSMKASPVFKDIKVEENALEYKGFKLSKTTMTFDIDKLMQQQGQANEQAAEMLKRWMGGALTVYSGTDSKRFVSIVGATEADAKAKLDAALSGGSSSIGQSAGYKEIRGRFPKQVGALVLINAQAMVKQFGNLAASFMGADIKTPDMPKETALFGMSYAATPDGYRFDIVVPSTVGPVFERGFGSLMQAMQGQVGQ